MVALLSQRNKTLARYLFPAVILALPLIYAVTANRLPGSEEIGRRIISEISALDNNTGGEIDELRFRASEIYKRFRINLLTHDDMLPGESAIILMDGVVDSYFGEVFYFRTAGVAEGEWRLLKKEDYLYFIERFPDDLYFVKKTVRIESIYKGLKEDFPFISSDVKFLDIPAKYSGSRVQYDKNIDAYFIHHLSGKTNNQLVLNIKFSTEDYLSHRKTEFQKRFLFLCMFLSLVFFLIPFKPPLRFRYFFLAVFLFCVFLLLLLFPDDSLYLEIHGFEIRSTALFFFFGLIWTLTIRTAGKRVNRPGTHILFSTAAMAVSLLFSIMLIRSVSFSFAEFSAGLNYLLFIGALFLFLTAPLSFPFRKESKRSAGGAVLTVLTAAAFLASMNIFFDIPIPVLVILQLTVIFNHYIQWTLISEVLRIFAMAAAVFFMLFLFSEKEKKDFISVGLKDIFSNQNNYAKFISRELIHNIHQRNENLSEYFKGDMSAELESIWRRSIALKENIASGIYVISMDRNMIGSFAYRIPYLNVMTENMFPYWMIDEFKAEYFGRTISAAVASINVYDGYDYLGKIVIQVMNSSDLITREHPENNIFMLNKRVYGRDLSYLKFNSKMQLIENPSNIDIQNLIGPGLSGEDWIAFDFMDTRFRGYIFENNEDTIIIFYPETTFSEIFSEIIKLFLFLLVMGMILNIKRIIDTEWKVLLKTFSFRVFAILIVISLFSAIIFSVISIGFNKRNRDLEFRREIYNSGQIAYDLISDIIEKNKNPDRDDLFFLSKVLDTDITIYRNDRLIDTSNYYRILNSGIPYLIDSKVPVMLEENEKFYIDESGDETRLFFNISDLTVRMDVAGKDLDILSRPGLYSDFIINLFFILTVAGIFLAFIFRRKILSPIHILNNKMSKVEIGELEEIAEIPDETELKDLFNGFNSMVSGIREQKKSISDIARMKTLIKLSRWIAHEVKNPLTPIKLSAEQILRSIRDKREDYENTISESVKYIIDETDHLRDISLGFLDISDLDRLKVSGFDLAGLCSKEVEKFRRIYRNIDFVFDHDDAPVMVRMDRMKIVQVLKNLLINSIESIMKKEGKIELKLEREAGNVRIALKDNGSGIVQPDTEKLFNEDFSTKSSGTGLGLFIVKRILDLHGGRISIESGSSGTVVRLVIPEVPGGKAENED